jgi:hypothetical protein
MALYTPRNHFSHTSDEILQMILSHLLVHEEPIAMAHSLHQPFPEVHSILLTCKRFHRIAEELIYRHNIFEIWDPDLWIDQFLMELSPFARSTITSLRLQWPSPASMDLRDLFEQVEGCTGLKQLDFTCFYGEMSKRTFGYFEKLSVPEIWFETPTGYRINLRDLSAFQHDGSAMVIFPYRIIFPHQINEACPLLPI